jgi:uncharacterized membrane protein YjgN (DUF898 family)
VTLGIYRFWLATDVRRYLWSNTEIAGDTFEYNGLATELLVGFLLAIAIVVPLYTAFAIVALAETVTLTSVVVAFLLVALLGEFALFRARRYRLTRTVFRGVRFDQHGSAWNYALRAVAWWVAVIVTLGLAYPWSQSSLQRFKMHNTSYGDLPGAFEGSGASLFVRGFPIWMLIVAPIVAAAIAFSTMIDWDYLSEMLARGDDDATAEIMGTLLFRGFGVSIICIVLSVISLVSLFPLFQAVLLRWWISGLRFGDMTVTSNLRTRDVYRVYLRFLLYLVLFGLAALVAGIAAVYTAGALTRPAHDSSLAELAASAITLVLYVAGALGVSIIYQVTVTAAMWRLGVQSAELAGTQALDNVRATGGPSSALGEGLADALGVGGI